MDQQTPSNPASKNGVATSARHHNASSIMSAGKTDDPYLYASMLSTFLGQSGPFKSIVEEVNRFILLVTETRKVNRQRLMQLESQKARLQEQISNQQEKTTGIRLDKLR